jgi:hypothetical protein
VWVAGAGVWCSVCVRVCVLLSEFLTGMADEAAANVAAPPAEPEAHVAAPAGPEATCFRDGPQMLACHTCVARTLFQDPVNKSSTESRGRPALHWNYTKKPLHIGVSKES